VHITQNFVKELKNFEESMYQGKHLKKTQTCLPKI